MSIAKACDFLLKSILGVVGFGFALLVFRLETMNVSIVIQTPKQLLTTGW